MTTAEKTMLDFGEGDAVRDFRQIFEHQMTERLTGMIEELTGRKILTYQIMFGPDRVVEMFVFDDAAAPEPIEATAEGRLSREPAGDVTDAEALEEPSSGGQEGQPG